MWTILDPSVCGVGKRSFHELIDICSSTCDWRLIRFCSLYCWCVFLASLTEQLGTLAARHVFPLRGRRRHGGLPGGLQPQSELVRVRDARPWSEERRKNLLTWPSWSCRPICTKIAKQMRRETQTQICMHVCVRACVRACMRVWEREAEEA